MLRICGRKPTVSTVSTAVVRRESTKIAPIERRTCSRSFAPKLRAGIMAKPFDRPFIMPIIRLFSELVAPTAASA